MPEEYIGPYRELIIGFLRCSPDDARMVEDIMRNEVFHSTLDWQSEAQLRRGAEQAWRILEKDRESFESYYRGVRAAFAEMKATERLP